MSPIFNPKKYSPHFADPCFTPQRHLRAPPRNILRNSAAPRQRAPLSARFSAPSVSLPHHPMTPLFFLRVTTPTTFSTRFALPELGQTLRTRRFREICQKPENYKIFPRDPAIHSKKKICKKAHCVIAIKKIANIR